MLLATILAVLLSLKAPSLSDAHARQASPGAAVEAAANALRPAEVLCLCESSYSGSNGIFKLTAAGATDRRIGIRSYPGERAKLQSHLWLNRDSSPRHGPQSLHDRRLHQPLDRAYLDTLTVHGDDAWVIGNDITHPKQIGVLVGANRNGNSPVTADGTLLRQPGPPLRGQSNNAKHGIYVSDGEGTRILGNLIHASADRGVQLYPNAQGTLVRGNVIDGNGEGNNIGGRDVYSSSNSTIENNIISNSKVRWNLESWWGEAQTIGKGNAVRNNCAYASNLNSRYNSNGTIRTGSSVGYALSDNVVADPLFLNRTVKDLRLHSGSPCASVLSRTGTNSVAT